MNAVKGYVKILAQPPSRREPLQHSKKISALYAACFVILVVAVGFAVVGFLHGKKTQQNERVFHGLRSSDLIEAVCNKTLYFKVCNSSLRSHPGALKANVSELARIAVEVSRDVAKDVVHLALDLNRTAGDNPPGSRGPLEDCVGLLGNSLDELNASLSAMGDENWRRRSEDVKTWLSAALTDPSTCIEGFEEVGISMPRCMKQKVDYLKQLVSNALAIFNYIAGVGVNTGKSHKTPGMNRRLLSGG